MLFVRTWLSFCLSMVATITLSADEFRSYHENVLGTSLELRVAADSPAASAAAEQWVLSEIDRLSGIFSTYDSTSELQRFLSLPVGGSMHLSEELFDGLSRCEQWTTASAGAFNPAVELLTQVWQSAASTGNVPETEVVRRSVHDVGSRHWQLDVASRTATRLTDSSLSLNAIAKGMIMDCVADRLMSETAGVHGVMLNIGGDLRVAGEMLADVGIADPAADAIGAKSFTRLRLVNGAVATSGGSERSFQIGNESYSHIIDPRSGRPVSQIISSTVMADEASTADALATICSVLSPADSLRLINAIPNAECLLMTASGVVLTSASWPQQETSTDKKQDGQQVPAGPTNQPPSPHDMLIQFEISKVDNPSRYRRPYVAVWVEDQDGFPVKTLSLFLMKDQPGPRWHRDLRRWYTDDQMRLLVDNTNLIETISKPTRNPGQYKVIWDGRDDGGELLDDGDYTLLIEVAREKGTYQLIKYPFKLGTSDFQDQLKGNVEIASASVVYRFKGSER